MSNFEIKEYICDESGARIDSWITEKLADVSRSYVRKLIDDEMVIVNGKVQKANYKVRVGDNIAIKIPEAVESEIVAENIPLDILYEDEHILVVNKEKGMVVHPAVGNYSGTLVNAVMYHCKDNLSDINGVIRPGIVHRIDKNTSGILVVAKSNQAHHKLAEVFKKHDIKRVYVAVVNGIIKENCGKIDAPIGRHENNRLKMSVNTKNGRDAITRFNVLERFKDTTLVEVQLETGRTHQIRVHMSYIGHSVVGDDVYGRKKNRYNLEGQALHAKILGFNHPITNEYLEFEAPVPEYFDKLIDTLRREI